MTLDRIWQLDVEGPNSNSNFAGAIIQENQTPPSHINNALRALGSMVAREIAYQSAAISASVSTNIGAASTGLFMAVVGAGNINSLGVVPGEQPSAAVFRFLEFSSSASLSHGPALRLIGGVSRRTQPGDIGGYIHCGAADSWHELFYSSAQGTNNAVNSLSASVVTATTMNAGSLSATAISNVTFLAHKNGTSQTSISATAVVTFGTEDWDIGGFFASNAWTPPAGKYRIAVQCAITGLGNNVAANTLILNLRKAGTNHRVTRLSRDTSESNAVLVLTAIVDASGTDAFDITIGVASDPPIAVLGTTTDTFFCGERI